MRRLVWGVLAANVLVLSALVVLTISGGDGQAADVVAEPDGTTDSPDPTVSIVDDASAFDGNDLDEPADTDAPTVEPEPEPAPVDEPDTGTETDAVEEPPVEDVPIALLYPPPYPDPFTPTVNEVQADAKVLGTLAAYAITNYDVEASFSDVLGTLPPVDEEFANAMALEVQTVYHADMWSRGTVEYAQLGGHLNGRISIIVVIRQELGIDGSATPLRTEKRTMEVRLARSESGAWELETIASAGGLPIERPADLSPLAAAVVDNPRIDLPDTGAWDIYAGFIDPALLQLMLDVEERTAYKVVVLQTGHSYNVFGTDRVSNHSVGRAVDIYEIEGNGSSELVIDAHDPSSQMYALSEWVVSRYDIREFGSPWKFPDAVAHTFTNEVHHDHLHIGVHRQGTAPSPPDPEDTTESAAPAD